MSKSKGNVVNPLEVVDKYGADALRFALAYGTALGNDQSLSYPKLDAMRKFTNKLWNMGRFVEFKRENRTTSLLSFPELEKLANNKIDVEMIKKTEAIAKKITKMLDAFDFNHAAQELYDFAWHEFADVYIEDVKTRIDHTSFTVLQSLYIILLKLIHPFMPFITEEIYQNIPGHGKSIMIENWPVTNEK